MHTLMYICLPTCCEVVWFIVLCKGRTVLEQICIRHIQCYMVCMQDVYIYVYYIDLI